ncbi:MAG: hypothetical protein Q9167_008105 [Letrouitia subvulpina]
MSALGSSVIQKSGRKFAPKAPVRRAPVSSPAETSTRTSVDRQLPSQSSQPHVSASQLLVPNNDPKPAYSASDNASTLQLRDPDRSRGSPSATNAPEHPQKLRTEAEALDSSKDVRNASGENSEASSSAVHAAQTTHAVSSKTKSSTTAGHCADSQKESAAQPVPPQSFSTNDAPSTASNSGIIPEPATKRRKLNQRAPKQYETQVNSEGHNIQPVVVAEANQNTAQDRRIAEADKISTRSQISVIPFSEPPTNAQRNKDLEAAAAKVVAEATRASDKRAKKSRPVSKPKIPRKAADPKTKATLIPTPENLVENARSKPQNAKGRRGRKFREPTPDGAENKRIVPGEVKMADLCKDNRQGRKSMREKALQERDKEEWAKRKQQETRNLVSESGTTEPVGSSVENQAENPVSRNDTAQLTLGEDNVRRVPGTQIIGGEIMVSEDQELDFHKEAAEQRQREQLESIDEDDLSRRVNSQTYMKREKLNVWSEELTDLFYDGLRMFGTDFGMISKMFPDRTRRAIKLKFTKEEKIHQDRVKEVLWGSRIPVDMEGFSKMTGLTFDDPQTHEREMEEDRKRLEEEAKLDQQFRDGASKQQTGETVSEQAAAENDLSTKENMVKRRKGKRDIKTKKHASEKKHRRKRKNVCGNDNEVLNPVQKD